MTIPDQNATKYCIHPCFKVVVVVIVIVLVLYYYLSFVFTVSFCLDIVKGESFSFAFL